MLTSMTQVGTKSKLTKWLPFIAVVGLLPACDKKPKLDPLTTINLASAITNQVGVNFCTPIAQQQKLYLKTLIILDHSGSNGQNYKMAADGSGAPDVSSGTLVVSPQYATDPQGFTRYGKTTSPGTLLNYLSTLSPNDPADPTRFFALVNFSSDASTYPTNSIGFTSDISGFYNHVVSDAGAPAGNPNDSGGTSYLSALNAAYNIINNDVQAAKNCSALPTSATPTASCPKPGTVTPSSYVVIFMSDGSPIIKIEGVGTDPSGNVVVTGDLVITKESTNEILGKVGSMVDLQTNNKFVASVNFFTIYYYHEGNIDASSQTLLSQMAKTGNGLPYNALSGSNINYAQFQPPTKQVQYILSDIFVTNTNGVWWNGNYVLDSDGDGLPDDVEKAWGSNPLKAISDGNGVSDLVKYKLTNASPCQSKNANGLCRDAVVNYKAGLCSAISTTSPGGVLTYKSSDPNGLNDCEKVLLNNQAGIGVPDSNQDSIPDWLEFINNVPFQAGSLPAVSQVNQDGYTTYQKIKYSLPVATPLNTMLNVLPANYNLTQVSSTALQTCYQLNVTHFPIVGPNNKVRVDITMKSNLIKDSYVYRVGLKSFGTNSNSLFFNDWTDATEISNKTWSSWP